MTMQNRPNNPIELRKQAVRRYTRNGALSVGGGMIGGVALAVLFGSWAWIIIGLVVAVVGGYRNWSKIQKIVNYNYRNGA
ncbi:hypothetical protein [Corynebacterium alimapuense]|uniref:Uncharacterized protein n=1 Tax=Corynebacterium alimapuense TaxID=1576874 RepID=A0A3M8KAH8_9CORY|nr:hypothetical protein [Corynebacterium alimapuense]RNE49468.1 hypothetical protein C5L39_03680 [Corynebacterium alimapuense]